MKKRKRQLTLNDWNQIPTAKVVDQPRETLASFTRKYNADQEAKRLEKLTAPLREIEKQLHAETREISRRVKAYYSLGFDEMRSYGIKAAPIAAAVLAGTWPTRNSLRHEDEEAEVYRSFRQTLAEQGTTLDEDGWARLGSWVA